MVREPQVPDLSHRNIEPAVFVTPPDNWVRLQARCVVATRERRIVRNELSRLFLDRLQESGDVTIASQTLTVTTIAAPSIPDSA